MRDNERRKAWRRAWYAAHRDTLNAEERAYRLIHRDELNRKRNIYNKNHPAGIEKKAKKKTYDREYNSRPEVQTRRRQLQRIRKLRVFYGITTAEFHALLRGQGFKCAICGTTDWGPQGPNIDHDHNTGKVRGILCRPCNLAIGNLREDELIAKSLASYLKLHSKNTESLRAS